jgi:DNA-binding NtrC family response regulator
MLLNEYLEELGFKVEIVVSAADAKSKLHLLSGEIDAAIVDVGLPDMRGDALVSELRSLYPMLPIVIASGHDEVTLQRQFMGEKCIGFLSKPYTAKQLRSALFSVGVLSLG